MALYYQLKFPSTFIEYRSVSEWKGVVVISNFDILEALQIYRPRQLPSLPRPKYAPAFTHMNINLDWTVTDFLLRPLAYP